MDSNVRIFKTPSSGHPSASLRTSFEFRSLGIVWVKFAALGGQLFLLQSCVTYIYFTVQKSDMNIQASIL